MMHDHVKPEERILGRRRDDLTGVRTARVVVFLLVAIIAAYGLAQKIDDTITMRETVRLAEQAAKVVHQLLLNCGL